MTNQRQSITRFLALILASCLAISISVAAETGMEDPLSPAAIQRRIVQHRTAAATVTLLGADGKPLANTAVTVRQVRHKFLFGCNAFGINPTNTSAAQQAYQQKFAALLNFATLPFYWGGYEPLEGRPAADSRGKMADWCAANGVMTKGHPLCWHTVPPKWAMDKTPDDLLKLQLGRITREVTQFKGQVDIWDVVNEAVVMPTYNSRPTPFPALCQKIGQVELIKQAFAAARAANPRATLILNDYDTSPKYEKLIQSCLDAGVGIDVIGIQSHMHSNYWGARHAWDICQRFGKFARPLNFTELTIISADAPKNIDWHGGKNAAWSSTPEGEQRQARQVAEFYSILFSHPAVSAITWWDFSDSGAWLGAPAGLVHKDMTPKPAYEALLKLVKNDWWTKEVKATTDAQGNLSFQGFLGDYALETSAGKAGFRLDTAGNASATARLAAK